MGISWFRKVLREIFVWLGIGLNTNTKPDKICEQCEGESPETTFDLQGGERLIEAVVPHNVGNASPTHYPSGPKSMRGWVDTGQGGGARGTARSLSLCVPSSNLLYIFHHQPSSKVLRFDRETSCVLIIAPSWRVCPGPHQPLCRPSNRTTRDYSRLPTDSLLERRTP